MMDNHSFKCGDFVTGVDRSYKRSVYKFLHPTNDPDVGLFEYQSLGNDCVDNWKDRNADPIRYQLKREYQEFRLADLHEIMEMNVAKIKYRLVRILKKLKIDAASNPLRF